MADKQRKGRSVQDRPFLRLGLYPTDLPPPSKDCSLRKSWGSVSSLRLAEYVTRVGTKKIPDKILVMKLQGRNPFGKILLKQNGRVWIGLIWSVTGRVCVYTVMNFRVSMKC